MDSIWHKHRIKTKTKLVFSMKNEALKQQITKIIRFDDRKKSKNKAKMNYLIILHTNIIDFAWKYK